MNDQKQPSFRSRQRNLVYGVGINDADYRVTLYEKTINGKKKVLWRCPYYFRWQSMLQRCYSEKCHKRSPTYIGCSVTENWIYFSNFKAWMETQDWEGKHLDKDLLFKGNKIYGPDTCVFLDAQLNQFIRSSDVKAGKWPVGVSLDKQLGKFKATCQDSVLGKAHHLGYFLTAEEGHAAWLAFKLEQAYLLAAEQVDERVAKALVDRYQNGGYLL